MLDKITAMAKEKEMHDKVERNFDRMHEIWELGKEENPIPDNTHCIVYCCNSNGSTEGWTEIKKLDDLGLEALIAQKWIAVADLK